MPPDPVFVTTTRATAVPLLPSEQVIFQVRKHLLFLITPIILMTVVAGALFIVAGTLALPSQLVGGLRIGIAVVTLFIDLLIFLDWLGTTYLLTNRRVQFRFGIIGEQTKTIALGQITDTRVLIGVLGRIFNYGTVVVEAANINSEIQFRNISSAETRLEQINDAKLNLVP